MWPFSKSDQKPDWREEGVAAFKAFRDIGQTFSYLGRTCVVCGHYQYEELAGCYPILSANYADEHGVIHLIRFSEGELPALRAQNPTEGA